MLIEDITIAWATPVDPVALGARLEAFAETKAATSTFRLCAKYASDSSIERLPPEIIENISSAALDLAFSERIHGWIKAHACLVNTCNDDHDFSNDEIDWLKEQFEEEGPFQYSLREWIAESGVDAKKHEEIVSDQINKLQLVQSAVGRDTLFGQGLHVWLFHHHSMEVLLTALADVRSRFRDRLSFQCVLPS